MLMFYILRQARTCLGGMNWSRACSWIRVAHSRGNGGMTSRTSIQVMYNFRLQGGNAVLTRQQKREFGLLAESPHFTSLSLFALSDSRSSNREHVRPSRA